MTIRPDLPPWTAVQVKSRREALWMRHTAIHEAGHLIIARHLGISWALAAIWRPVGRSYCDGRTFLWSRPVVSRDHWVMCAVAGGAATQLWHHRRRPHAAGDALPSFDGDQISDGDWRDIFNRTGTPATKADAQCIIAIGNHTIGLLAGRLWQDVLDAARELIEEGIIECGERPYWLRVETEDDAGAAPAIGQPDVS